MIRLLIAAVFILAACMVTPITLNAGSEEVVKAVVDINKTSIIMNGIVRVAARWFEEGLAALYENTDSSYRGIENNWRDRVMEKTRLKKKGDKWQISPEFFKSRVLSISLLEFEHSPVPATVTREYLRNVQDCGDLPGLYKKMRMRYMQRENLTESEWAPHRSPTNKMVDDWYRLSRQFILTKCP